MNKNQTKAWFSLTTSIFAVAALAPCNAIAQQEVVKTVEEIVVVGTRRQGRTAIETAVPVDVFNRQALDSVSSDDMLDIIRTLVPSFQVQRFPINDGATFVRPPTLRGMSADKILVLVNGKRRHRSALVQLSGDGVHGPDLATIPSIALRSVEVLRDGASAMYGSDAIAGVFNFNLRDSAEGGEVRLQTGMYTEGNESGYLLSFNQGLSLGGNGFINISAELSDNEPTSRGTFYTAGGFTPVEAAQVSGFFDHDMNPATPDQQRFGPDALTEIYDPLSGEFITLGRGSDGIPDDIDTRYADNLQSADLSDGQLVQIWGAPDRKAFNSFINAGLELEGGRELYGWMNYSQSDSNGSFFHRTPRDASIVPLRTETGEIYNPRDRYPAGFTPRFAGEVIDVGVTGGIRGEFGNGMSYDFSGRWGESTLKYTIYNTLNPSLGPETPTSFRPGDVVSDEAAFNADFALPVDVGFASDLNVAFGVEYRDEGYKLVEGDPKSYEAGPYAFPDPFNFEIDADEAAAGQNGGSVGCFIPGPQFDPASLCHPDDPIHNVGLVGSNGFPGYRPEHTSTYARDSWAGYVDLEADITDRFMASVAGRYEDFSDFGSNFSWRLAARLQATEVLTLRGSAGTGFRAPTPGQISSIKVSTGAFQSGPITRGLFPPQDPASQIFGAVPLRDETSTQFTLGLALQPSDAFTMTLDYYFIALDNRIWVSSNFDVGPAERAQLIALGVPGAEQLTTVRFFTNDLDTETQGIDLVAHYNIDWNAGNTGLSLAVNVNDTEVTRRTNRQTDPTNPDPVYFLSDSDVFRIENGDPDFRANLTAMHSWTNNVSATLRGNWYGDYTFVSPRNVSQVQDMSGDVYWDLDLTWVVSDALSVTLGGNNIFDAGPDQQPSWFTCCGITVHEQSVMDWQGPYYYVRGVLRWN
ncbi:MAG: TonB-dependent receptor [Gammaproteobacteria bacterium]|nr:MAG: TonB-dependent receptor [Gammaproteobacteria bacterium]RLA37087.1 MAG: TonB-dependent receptor [Gammaproteobacteria bacterium]